MRRAIALSALIALTTVVGSPNNVEAQSGGNVAPVPGPYRAAAPAPAPQVNPYSNPANGQAMPYWMRTQPNQAGRGAGPIGNQAPRNFIPGWAWSPYPPNGAPVRTGQSAPQYGGGYWPQSPQPGFGTIPWGPPGYSPTPWPNRPYGASQHNGAYPQPNQ